MCVTGSTAMKPDIEEMRQTNLESEVDPDPMGEQTYIANRGRDEAGRSGK